MFTSTFKKSISKKGLQSVHVSPSVLKFLKTFVKLLSGTSFLATVLSERSSDHQSGLTLIDGKLSRKVLETRKMLTDLEFHTGLLFFPRTSNM